MARFSRILLEIILTVILGAVLMVGAALWRLAEGPVPLGFLRDDLARALSPTDRPVHAEIGQVWLEWQGWGRRLDFVVESARLVDDAGTELMSVPRMAVTLSAGALFQGRVAARRLEIAEARLELRRDRLGRFSMGVLADDSAPSEAAGLLAGTPLLTVMAMLDHAEDTGGPLKWLEEIRIRDAELDVSDQSLGLDWDARQVNVAIERTDAGIAARSDLILDLPGQDSRARMAVDLRRPDGTVSLRAELDDVYPPSLAAMFGALAPLQRLDLLVSLRLEGQMALGKGLESLRFELEGDSGRVDLSPLAPVSVGALRLAGTAGDNLTRVTLQDAFFALDGPTITADAELTRKGADWTMGARVVLVDLPVADLARYWPADAAAGGREWVMANISGGMVDHASLDLDLSGAETDVTVTDLSADLRYQGLTVQPMAGLPPITDIVGTGRLGLEELVFDVDSARVEGQAVTGARVTLDSLGAAREWLAVAVDLAGPLAGALAIVDRPPLELLKSLDGRPSDFSGRQRTHLTVRLPLEDDLAFADVDLKAAVEVRDAAANAQAFGVAFDQGRFRLDVTPADLALDGRARVYGVPFDITWRQDFGPGGAGRYQVKGTVTPAALGRMGAPDLPFLTGPVAVDAQLTEPAGGGDQPFAVTADLTGAGLSLDALDWGKPAGVGGRLEVAGRLRGARLVALDRVRLRAPDLSLDGAVAFAGGQPTLFRVDRLALGDSDLAGRVWPANGGWAAEVRGRLDAEFLIAGRADDEATEAVDLPAISLTADLDSLRIDPDMTLTRVRGRVDYRDDRVAAADLSASLGTAEARLRVGPQGVGRLWRLDSGDAGRLLAALDVLDTVREGRLVIVAQTDDRLPDQPMAGRIEVTRFRLIDAPILARILSLAALTGILEMLEAGEGLPFDRLVGRFHWQDRRLTLDQASANSLSLGLTARGWLDIDSRRMDIRGTVVPIYLINSLPGRLPLIGALFTSEEEGGLFAADFTAQGALDDPSVSVNPLTVLAPGFLRDLFVGGPSAPPSEPTRQRNSE